MSETFKTAASPRLDDAWPQPRPTRSEEMKARLDMIGIVVEDMGRSLAFYRELGLELPDDADGQPHVEATLPGGMRFALDTEETIRSFDPSWQAPSGGVRIGLAFLLDSPADVDAAYERLVSLGYDGHKEPWDAPWGQRYALMRDPDGNGVDLFCPL
jgi:catechol 2,3-dioxygenase-like lactoylglutathione lyase family enzyme